MVLVLVLVLVLVTQSAAQTVRTTTKAEALDGMAVCAPVANRRLEGS